ncbi:MAG: GIY-YIG nuclease family protein [Bacteroidia bacterium]|nr:GIY-YIG nuclease family protein [Bacteroidia bacterium]MCF8427912.1 GIY-YIG nuclease family protein [Bacteroidia bacterium]MCF8448161.1 GIY-YIG nuclease family protein [Bacteroidia bacterium]
MPHFVYIIYSQTFDIYYKGYSLNPENRIIEHNTNQSSYTENKGPWELVYVKGYQTKREALIEERRIKKLNRNSIEKLIAG